MQESKKFVFDVSITFFASISNMFIGLVLTVIIGRYLGAGDLGLYRMISTIYSLFVLVAAAGLPGAMTRYTANFKSDQNELNRFASAGIITSVLVGILCTLLFYCFPGVIVYIFNMPGLEDLLRIVSIIYPFALLNGVLFGILNGLRQMKLFGMAIIAQSILMIMFTLPLVYFGYGVLGVVTGLVLSTAATSLILLLACLKHIRIIFKDFISTNKEIINFGIQGLAASIVNNMNSQFDVLIIGFFLSAVDLGYYTVALYLSRFFLFIPDSVQRITFPATSTYWGEQNFKSIDRMINTSLKYCTVILIPIGLFIFFFAKDVIVLMFKGNFIYAVLPLNILLVGAMVKGCIDYPIGSSLYGIGRPDLSLKICTMEAIINLGLDLLLVPQFGLVGAAVAVVTSMVVTSLVHLYLVIKIIRIKFDGRWYLMISGLAIMAVMLYFAGLSFINAYILALAIMMAFMLLLYRYFLDTGDKEFFKNIVFNMMDDVYHNIRPGKVSA
jgi:O-antigen/teichoic acid export membrane protein